MTLELISCSASFLSRAFGVWYQTVVCDANRVVQHNRFDGRGLTALSRGAMTSIGA